MATYKIFENDKVINTIEANAAFCEAYCEKHGFAYELIPTPAVEPEPTDTEVINALLGVNE